MRKMLVALCIVAMLLTIMVPAFANESISEASLASSDKVTVEEGVKIDDALSLSDEEKAIEDVDEYNAMIEEKVEALAESFFEVEDDDEEGKAAVEKATKALKILASKGSADGNFITPKEFYEMVAPKNAEVPEEQKQQESSEIDYEEATTNDVAKTLEGYHFSTQFASLAKEGESGTITLKTKDANENTKYIWIGKDGTIVIVTPLLGEDGKPLLDEDGNYVFEFPGEGLIAQIDQAEAE